MDSLRGPSERSGSASMRTIPRFVLQTLGWAALHWAVAVLLSVSFRALPMSLMAQPNGVLALPNGALCFLIDVKNVLFFPAVPLVFLLEVWLDWRVPGRFWPQILFLATSLLWGFTCAALARILQPWLALQKIDEKTDDHARE